MEEELPQATIGELKQELQDAINSGKQIDREHVRRVRKTLCDLVFLFADGDEEPDHVQLEWEAVEAVRSSIKKVIINPDEDEEV